VPIVLLAIECLGIYHNLSVWYTVTDTRTFGAYISVFEAILSLALNSWLIPIISYVGSAIATLSAYTFMMFVSYYYGNKYYPIPYNLKKMGLYLSVSSTFSVISFYVYRANYYVGLSLLTLFLFLVVLLEKYQ